MRQELEQELEALIGKINNEKDFHQVRSQLLKRGIESLLKAELAAHMGFEKGDKPLSNNIRNGFSKKIIKMQNGEQCIDTSTSSVTIFREIDRLVPSR